MRGRGVDYLAYALIDALVDSYFPLLESYGEQIEALEEQVLRGPSRRGSSRSYGCGASS